VGLAINKVAFIEVARGEDEPSSAISRVVGPVAFVLGAVGPDLNTLALSEAASRPLAVVDGPSF
jgi:hypothetical protein